MAYSGGRAFSTLGQRLLDLAGTLGQKRRQREEDDLYQTERDEGLALQGFFRQPPTVPQTIGGVTGPGGVSMPAVQTGSMPDPSYEQLPGTELWRQSPEVLAERDAARRADAMERSRTEIGGAIDALSAGGQVGPNAAILETYDVDPTDYIAEPGDDIPAWQREAEYYAGIVGPNGERYGPKGQVLTTTPKGGTNPDEELPTYSEAMRHIRDSYTEVTVDDYGNRHERFLLTPEQAHGYALKMTRGETVPLPAGPGQGPVLRTDQSDLMSASIMKSAGAPPEPDSIAVPDTMAMAKAPVAGEPPVPEPAVVDSLPPEPSDDEPDAPTAVSPMQDSVLSRSIATSAKAPVAETEPTLPEPTVSATPPAEPVAADTTISVSEEEVASIKRMIETAGLSPEAARGMLLEEGASEEEIRAILGSTGPMKGTRPRSR